MGMLLYTWNGKLERLDFGVYCAGLEPGNGNDFGRMAWGCSWRLIIFRRGSCDSDLSLMA